MGKFLNFIGLEETEEDDAILGDEPQEQPQKKFPEMQRASTLWSFSSLFAILLLLVS